MNWKELWEWFIREIIAECKSAIIKWFIWVLIRLITKKILQSKEKKYKERKMQKQTKKSVAKIKKDNGRTGAFRDKTRGRISVHAFSCHADVWQEIEEQKLKRNMSVGQYIEPLHKSYQKLAYQKEA